jgi:hypothetical protein
MSQMQRRMEEMQRGPKRPGTALHPGIPPRRARRAVASQAQARPDRAAPELR